MTKRKERVIRIIRRSCLTGKVVWIRHHMSYKAEWAAYRRACQREIERVQGWCAISARRKANIQKLLDELTASMPIDSELSPEKKDAARRIAAIANTPLRCHRDFYDHIMEERRRKKRK